MEWYLYIVVIAAGFAAGFINTLAGSGSLITLPLLIMLGLPANVANGTNRVSILFQNVVAVRSFHRLKVLDIRKTMVIVIVAVLGAIIGARIAVHLDEVIMRRTIGILMVVMLVVTLVQPKRWLEQDDSAGRKTGWARVLIFFAIGLYGGFIQAGVGIFLLASLVLGAGYDLVRANAAKVLIVLCFTVPALAVFTISEQVNWGIGFLLAVGSMSGALVAARMAVRRGAVFVRWILIAVLVVSAGYLLEVFEWAR